MTVRYTRLLGNSERRCLACRLSSIRHPLRQALHSQWWSLDLVGLEPSPRRSTPSYQRGGYTCTKHRSFMFHVDISALVLHSSSVLELASVDSAQSSAWHLECWAYLNLPNISDSRQAFDSINDLKSQRGKKPCFQAHNATGGLLDDLFHTKMS